MNIVSFIDSFLKALLNTSYFQQILFLVTVSVSFIINKGWVFGLLKRLKLIILNNQLRFGSSSGQKQNAKEQFCLYLFCSVFSYYLWIICAIILVLSLAYLVVIMVHNAHFTFIKICIFVFVILFSSSVLLSIYNARLILSFLFKGDRMGLVGILSTKIKNVKDSCFDNSNSEDLAYAPIHFANCYEEPNYEKRIPYSKDRINQEYSEKIEPYFIDLKKKIIGDPKLKNKDLFYVYFEGERKHICDFLLHVYRPKNIWEKIILVENKMKDENRINFIGNKIGVSGMKIDNGNLTLTTYVTDHFTWLVFKEIFKEKESDIKDVFQLFLRRLNRANTLEQDYILRCMKFLFSSFGFDVLVVGRNARGKKRMLIGVRKGSIEQSGYDKLHIPVNESFSTTDLNNDEQDVSPINCIKRGIIEELGLPLDIIEKATINYHDFAVVTDEGEIGLSCSIDFSSVISSEEIRCYAGQDKYMELKGLVDVPYPPFYWNHKKYPTYFYKKAHNDILCTPWESFAPILYQRCVVRGAEQTTINKRVWVFLISSYISIYIWLFWGSKIPIDQFSSFFVVEVINLFWNILIAGFVSFWLFISNDYYNYIMPLVPQWGGDVDVLQCTEQSPVKKHLKEKKNIVAEGIKFGLKLKPNESKELVLDGVQLKTSPYCSVRRELDRAEFPISFYLLDEDTSIPNNRLFFMELPCYERGDLICVEMDIKYIKKNCKYFFSRPLKNDYKITLKESFNSNEIKTLSKYYSMPEELFLDLRYGSLPKEFVDKYSFLDLFQYNRNYYWCIQQIRYSQNIPKTIELSSKTNIYNDIVKGINKNATIMIKGSRDLIEKKLSEFINHESNRKRISPLDIYMLQLALIRMRGDGSNGILLAIKHRKLWRRVVSRIKTEIKKIKNRFGKIE